jgi:RNA polymerase sigma-70 factor (ECF subfamily)
MRVSSSSAFAPAALRATWPDAALVEALAQNDEQAFAEVYERYWQALYQQAVRKLGRTEDAEEVVQDLFVALWHKRHAINIERLDAYLASALKYRIIDFIRARMVRQKYAATGPHLHATPDCSTEEAVAATDLEQSLADSVRQLPGKTHEVFRLSRLEYQSTAQIAARLRVSTKTVEYHLSRSLQFLRISLRDFLA